MAGGCGWEWSGGREHAVAYLETRTPLIHEFHKQFTTPALAQCLHKHGQDSSHCVSIVTVYDMVILATSALKKS